MEESVKELLAEYTGHKAIELTSRGNTAIFASLYCARKLKPGKKKVLVPDQGGWFSYVKYPKMLELSVEEVATDSGLMNPDELDVADACALLYSNPAGYFADQSIKEIYEVCENKCVVIIDVSGCLGDAELCRGNYADIMVGSFGKWKIVDLGYGGFVSFREIEDYSKPKEIFNTTSFEESRLGELLERLNAAKERLAYLYRVCEKVKKDLAEYDVVHADKKGVNVVVRFRKEKEKKELVQYCESNKYEYTFCPRYMRVLEPAISIEVKRL